MSRFAWLVAVCGLALTAAPAFANNPRQTADVIREGPPTPAEAAALVAALKEKVEYDGSKIGEKSLSEVLQALAKKHKITFVLMEEEFKAKKVADIKEKKSRVKQLDTKDMILTELLDAWLPGMGATYKIHEDYIAVVPLPVKVQEPNPAFKLRQNDTKEDPKPAAKKVDQTERVLGTLDLEFQLKDDSNYNETPLFELLHAISKKYELPLTLNEESFKAVGQANIKDEKPKLAVANLRGVTLHQFLTMTLDSVGATYLVKNGVIEVVPIQHAAKVTKSTTARGDGEDDRVRLNQPLVSAIFKEKPLNEAVAKIAEMYDLTIVVSPQAGDAKTGFVTARMLNLPADKALELLALQCDLRVVRKGTAFLITSKDNANELFNEKLEKERQKIEVQKLREAPAKPPAPPEKPADVPPAPPAPKM